MTSAPWFRQATALGVLLLRHWLRSGLPGSRIERFRKASGLVVRLAVVVLFVQLGTMLGNVSLSEAARGRQPVEWLVVSVVGFGVCWGVMARARALRGMALPLGSPLLDTLPLQDPIRTFVEFFEVGTVHVLIAIAFLTASPALPAVASISLGLATSVASIATGAAMMRWAFVLLSPERTVTVAQVATIGQGFFLMLCFLGQMDFWEVRAIVVSPLARPLAGEGGLGIGFAFAICTLAAALVALGVAERIGYDRVDVVPRQRFAAAPLEALFVGHIDVLLAKREPGNRQWPIVVFGIAILAGFAAVLVFVDSVFEEPTFRLASLVGLTAWMTIPTGAVLASRSVTRDLVARPFLASLPVEPHQLLSGKVKVVRQRLMLGLFPLAFMLVAPLEWGAWREIAWRSLAVAVGLWIYGSAAVAVAFLTGGAQGARPQPGGTFRLESLLLLVPLVTLFFATSPWVALVPLAALLLVAVEARRAALRVARWIDDGEDFERETSAWRAALAFAAFQGTQVLATRLIAEWTTDSGVLLGASYAASGLVLAGLTLHGRRDLAPVHAWPRNRWMLPLGFTGGLGTAAFAHWVLRWMLSADPRTGLDVLSTEAGQVAFALTTVTIAPLVEELFFRGWLQPAVASDLDPSKKWLAPVLAALAFAVVHPPSSFPAVFALGLVAGVLCARTSSLAPAVLAHAAHNLGVVLLS